VSNGELDHTHKDSSYIIPELSVGDISWLRTLASQYKDNPELSTEFFFEFALLGYYDVMWSGLQGICGDFVYRLSDFVPLEDRKKMLIYPSSNGSLVIDDSVWDSLEDWRRRCEKSRGAIPFYQPQLPPGVDELGRIIGSRHLAK
jgi:hypothetical protein